METTGKLTLVAIENTESGKKIAFASFLKQDYVAKSLVIYLDGNSVITGIFFSSDAHGTVEWINGSGLKNSHRWESEDQAKSRSYLTRRYTAILSNGSAGTDFARDYIIPDILDNMESAEVAEWVADLLRTREYLVPVDISRFKVN
jgi:hypothetical protein